MAKQRMTVKEVLGWMDRMAIYIDTKKNEWQGKDKEIWQYYDGQYTVINHLCTLLTGSTKRIESIQNVIDYDDKR